MSESPTGHLWQTLTADFFADVLEKLGVGMWLYDIPSETVEWTPSLYRLLGMEPGPAGITYEQVRERIHPEDRSLEQETVALILRQGGHDGFELRMRHAAGHYIWVHSRGHLMSTDGGETDLMVGLLRDVTARREDAERLRQSDERFRLLLQNSAPIIFMLDREGRFLLSEGRMLRALGLKPGQVVGQSAWDLYGEYAEVIDALNRAMNGETVRATTHVQGRSFDSFFSPTRDSSGAVSGLIGMSVDITEQVRMRERQEHLEAQFQASQKLESLGLLAGSMAHDFNNMLTGIMGEAEIGLLESEDHPSAFQAFRSIVRISQDAAALCRQLLAYSGRGHLVRAPLDLNTTVADAERMLWIALERRGELSLEPSGEEAWITGDRTQLQQILLNVVNNAAAALPDTGGRITLSVSDYRPAGEEDNWLAEPPEPGILYRRLVISDNGAGMETEVLEHIFEPFFTTRKEGHGLGLAAVLGIVRGHEGAVRVLSRPGEGARFEFLFPAIGTPAPAPADAESPAMAPGPNCRILVVDDDPAVLNVAARMIRRLGHQPVTASSGEEALEILRRNGTRDFDLVLLDVTMPGMSGTKTAVHIAVLDKSLPVVLSSGYSHEDLGLTQKRANVAGLLGKPYRISDLETALQNCMSRR